MPTEFEIILTTFPSRRAAERVVRYLLKERMIACANLIDKVHSRFRWKGRIDAQEEVLVLMKARRKNFRKIEREIKRMHAYEVPEIISTGIAAASASYLRWLDENS